MIAKKIIFKDTAIHYKIFGTGVPVMLIHGFGEDNNIWKNQVAFLQEKFMVITPDVPGSGESEMLNQKNVSINDYALVIKQIAENENLSTFSIFGHSMGGYISLAYYKMFPNDINGIGLIHSTAFADNELKIEIRKKAIEFIQNNGAQTFLKTSIPNLFYDKQKHSSIIDQLINNGKSYNENTLIQYYQAMMNREDNRNLLKDSTVPFLFIGGLHDQAVAIKDTLEQMYLPSIAHIHILRNSAHMGMLEETDKTNKIILDYLQFISALSQNQSSQ